MTVEKGLVSKSYLTAIADAIRKKTNSTSTYTPDKMADAISGITTGSNDWELVVNQSSHQTITATPKAVMTDLGNNKYRLTLDADTTITADNGYTAGTISKLTNGNILTINATAATKTTTNSNRFVINKTNRNNAINLIIDSSVYTCSQPTGYYLFDVGEKNWGSDYFTMNIKYNSTITSSRFNNNGVLYKFFNFHTLTVTKEKDGYGLSYPSPYDFYGGDSYESVFWSYSSASNVLRTSDSTLTVWRNLKTSFANGENLVVEFTD